MRVYFDMDGVLANFDAGVLQKFGIDTADRKDRKKVPNRAKFDDVMWEKVREDAHFFRELEPFPETLALLHEVIDRIGAANVAILTAVPRPEREVVHAAEDKRAWIREHVRADIEVRIGLRADKAASATSADDILVDDHEGNIKEWEAAGGRGILHTSAEETRARLVELGVL